MLKIKRIEIGENGAVTAIDFEENAWADDVVGFCTKYKIGWQNFKQPETLSSQQASTEWLRGGTIHKMTYQPPIDAIGKPLGDIDNPIKKPDIS